MEGLSTGMYRIRGWRGCRQRDAHDSWVEGLSTEGFIGFIGGGTVARGIRTPSLLRFSRSDAAAGSLAWRRRSVVQFESGCVHAVSRRIDSSRRRRSGREIRGASPRCKGWWRTCHVRKGSCHVRKGGYQVREGGCHVRNGSCRVRWRQPWSEPALHGL